VIRFQPPGKPLDSDGNIGTRLMVIKNRTRLMACFNS